MTCLTFQVRMTSFRCRENGYQAIFGPGTSGERKALPKRFPPAGLNEEKSMQKFSGFDSLGIFFFLVACPLVTAADDKPADKKTLDGRDRTSRIAPVIHVAAGLNTDGKLVRHYRRGLDYAIKYFGNYGPYHVYLLGPDSEASVRKIYRQRAASRVDPQSEIPAEKQIEAYLRRPNVLDEIEAVLSGKAEGGLTWTQDPPKLYEDVTTNAKGREKDPLENTWGALHEYHHVFQMAHCDTRLKRDSEKNIPSWIAEGMASYSSARFMDNLGLVDSRAYLLELRKTGGNIGRPGINEFLTRNKDWQLQDESYWDSGQAPQVYYMLGAWATAYLIHGLGVDEVTVLKTWYQDIPRLGKSAAFEKHMGIPLDEFHTRFRRFILQSDKDVMKIFEATASQDRVR